MEVISLRRRPVLQDQSVELKCDALDSTVFDAAGRQCHHCSGGLPLNLRHRYLVRGFMHCGQSGRVVCLFCNTLHACPHCADYANKERVHICAFMTTCGMYLSTNSALQLHEGLTHSSPSFCGLCKREIKKNIVEHCKKQHPEIDPNELAALDRGNALVIPAGMKLQCPFCEACFDTEHDVRMHVLTVHQCRSACGHSSSSKKALTCRKCQQIKVKAALLLHGQSHLGASTEKVSGFPCKFCDGVFQTFGDKWLHVLRAHPGRFNEDPKAEFAVKRQGNRSRRKTKPEPIVYGNHFGLAGDFQSNSIGVSGKGATSKKNISLPKFSGAQGQADVRSAESTKFRKEQRKRRKEAAKKKVNREIKAKEMSERRDSARSAKTTRGNNEDVTTDKNKGSFATDPKGNAKSALTKPGPSAKKKPDKYAVDESMPCGNGAVQGKEVRAGHSANNCEPPKACQQDQEAEQYRKLFVRGLSLNTTDEMLKEFYSRFGVVVRCFVVRDTFSKRSRGFGFVTFRKSENVDFAMKARPHIIDRNTIEPRRALPKTLENQVSVKKLCVSGITNELNEQSLSEHFAAFGTVTDVSIMLDKNGRTRGFAFVTFDDFDPVDKSILLRWHTICGIRCDVKKVLSKDVIRWAEQHQRERQERGAQSRGGGDGDRWRGASDVGYGRGGGYNAGYRGDYGNGRLGD